MKIGVSLPSFATDGYRLPPGQIQSYAREAEDRGFAGLWQTEHLLRPPAYRFSRLDPLTTLSIVAGATETIPIGPSVLLLPLRNPVMVAKRAATIQHMSGDRLTLGLGLGWSEAEFDAAGVPYEERGPRYTECLELLTRLLTERNVTFDGKYYQVEGVTIEPQLSRPPRILIGGSGVDRDGERRVPRVIKKRIDRFGDGWIAATRAPDVHAEDWEDIAEYLASQARDPEMVDTAAIAWAHVVPGASTETAEREQRKVYSNVVSEERGIDFAMRHNLTGSVEDIHEQLEAYEAVGFDEIILGPSTSDPAEVKRQLGIWDEHLLSRYE